MKIEVLLHDFCEDCDYWCDYCTNFDKEPEVKSIALYKGPNYYVMDIERPEGFIPEPWRNKRLFVNYCPLCGRKLESDRLSRQKGE